ncbi:MAG: tRNA pseudouridine synthase A [Thermomicrobiales bacterium]
MSSASKSAARLRQERGGRPSGALKITVSYDGKDFFGSQRQPGKRTVQGELERAILETVGVELPVYLAGRTDQGVHAAGQVGSFADYRPGMELETLRRALNARLADDSSVQKVERKHLGFHARYDAAWREYRYRIWCGVRQPLTATMTWQRETSLDIARMALGAEKLSGPLEMAAFAGGGEGVPWSDRRRSARGTVRTILLASVIGQTVTWGASSDAGSLIEIRLVADGFLPRMVRGIVGALVEIGRGAREPEWIDELVAGGDRRLGPMNAPAHGLTLWRVGYGSDDPRDDAAGTGDGGRPTEGD